MQKVDNVFFLDENVTDTLQKIINNQSKYSVSKAGTSVIVMLNINDESISILFRPTEENFTYEVNGHFYGTFHFTNDKVVVKWPNRLRDKEKRKIMREVQNIFRENL